jgi:primase-polymerase (primpol)-like protein
LGVLDSRKDQRTDRHVREYDESFDLGPGSRAVVQYHKDHKRLGGLGFVFTRESGIVGIDLDHCRNPYTSLHDPWAQRNAEGFETYTEVSQTEGGVHLYLFGAMRGSSVG